MIIRHFTGPDRYGGHRRYALIVHNVMCEMGLNSVVHFELSELLEKMRSEQEPQQLVLIFHTYDQWKPSDIVELRRRGVGRFIFFAHNPHGHPFHELFDKVVPVSEYVRSRILSFSPAPVFELTGASYIPRSRLKFKSDDLAEIGRSTVAGMVKNSEYMWNFKKPRDCLLACLEKMGLYPVEGVSRYEKVKISEHKDTVQLAVVSRLVPFKQWPRIFRTLFEKSLSNRYKKFTLHIIGAGPWRTVQEIKSSVPKIFWNRIFFWGWQPNPLSLMENFDAMLCGYPEEEALGLNVLEATNMRLPTVAFRGGPFDEVIEHGRNGWLFESESVDLVESLDAILEKLIDIKMCSKQALTFEMSGRYNHRFSEERFNNFIIELLS